MKYKVTKVQNVSKSCIVCGIENDLGLHTNFYELESGDIVSLSNTKEWHQSYPGRVHGGIITAILDETIGRAVSVNNDDIWGVTISIEVQFKKPVPLDETIKCIGRITTENRKLFEGTGEIILKDGTVAAKAHGKYMKMPVGKITDADFEEEWIPVTENDIQYIEI
ncbi:MAG: PaaI family thioesterase [Clostridioides sp.]|jgi:acyl-coenzyme A thioesterase PaaI-like protein|nr:PaaI family thioesterase [Clostridioides sp.]